MRVEAFSYSHAPRHSGIDMAQEATRAEQNGAFTTAEGGAE